MAKKQKLSLKQKAQKLRSYGVDVSFGKRGKTGKQYKGQVTRKWKQYGPFVENTKQRFEFQRANKRTRETLQKGLNSRQFTPKGFFIRVPKGCKEMPEYDIREDGTIHYKCKNEKGGYIKEEIYPISPELLAEDPPRAILELSKVAAKDKIVLTVNGWDSTDTLTYGLQDLSYYVAHDLLPKFLDPNLNEAYAAAHGKKLKNGKYKKRTIKDFVNTFHIKISRYGKTAKRKKSKRKR